MTSQLLLVLASAPALKETNAAVDITSMWDFVVKGGIVMIPIGICSLIALAITVERLLVTRPSRVIPTGFLARLRELVSSGERARCLDYCRQAPSPIARICEAGLHNWNLALEQVEKSITDAGHREIARLRTNMRGLSVIASIAPLLGLLGTIFGMIKAFQTVAASGDALGRTELLAAGIYEAMITTAAGLIVAIPVIVIYNFIIARIDRLVLEMDAACLELVKEHRLMSATAPVAVAVRTPTAAAVDEYATVTA